MGEYALYKNNEIKIGTCETMYYLRYEDRHKVKAISGSVDPSRQPEGLRFRCPIYSEDGIEPGHYQSHINEGIWLYDKEKNFDLSECDAGRIAFRDEASGLQVTVPCYHGFKTADQDYGEIKLGFNGFSRPAYIKYLKVHNGLVVPVIACKHCDSEWRTTWAEIWDFVPVAFRGCDYKERFHDYYIAELKAEKARLESAQVSA